MGASGTGGTVVMLLASKEYGEKKKRFKGMQDDYRLRPNVCNIEEKKNHHLYLPREEFTGINWVHVALQSCLSEILKERILKT